MKAKGISIQCYQQSQSWYYTNYLVAEDQSFRIDIERNAYDQQSHARIYRWDGSQWQLVYSEPIQLCECVKISYTDKNIVPGKFLKDATRLLTNALRIINSIGKDN